MIGLLFTELLGLVCLPGLSGIGLDSLSSPAFVYKKWSRTSSPTGQIIPHMRDYAVPGGRVGLIVPD